jgi:hypothetical protein
MGETKVTGTEDGAIMGAEHGIGGGWCEVYFNFLGVFIVE